MLSRNLFISLIIFGLMNGLFSCGQTIRFISQDSTAINQAKVLVTNSNNQILAIAYTDEYGELKYKFDTLIKYNLNITHSSYQPRKIQVTFSTKEIKIYKLDRLVEGLDQILISAKKSIVKKGDTTTIDIKKFALPTDKNLKQVISRIPGMEISKNGDITYRGKKITDLLINGRKLFDQDYNRAIEFINSKKAVELKIIEKYNDYHGFKEKIVNSNAIDVVYEGKNIYTSQVAAGYGTKDMKKAQYSHVLATKLLSNYTKATYENLGVINYSSTTNNTPRKKPVFYQITRNQEHSKSLNAVNGNFVESYLLDTNTNIPIGSKKEKPLTIKFSAQNENSFININTESVLFTQESLINRSQDINTTFDSNSNSILGTYKYETKSFYLNSELFISQGKSNRNSVNKINNILTLDNQYQTTDQRVLNTIFQIKNKNSKIHDFNFIIANKEEINDYESLGINEFNQTIKNKSFNLYGIYEHHLIQKNKIKLLLSSTLNLVQSNFNIENTNNTSQENNGLESNNIWLNQLQTIYQPNKNFIASLTLNNTNLSYKNQFLDNFNKTLLLNPNISIRAKIGGVINQIDYSHNYNRITNNPSSKIEIFNNNTFSESYNIDNPFQESHNYKYQLKWGDFINSWNSSISFSKKNNLLISNFSFTENSTNIEYFNEDLDEQQLFVHISRDFLFLKKFNVKISVDYTSIKGFQSSEGNIASIKNENTSLYFEVSKRLGKHWFFRSTSNFARNNVTFNDSFSNQVFNLSTDLDLEYAFEKSTAKIEYKLNDFGLNNYLHFLNTEYTYNIDKWSSSLSISAINLLDINSIDRKNISPQTTFTSSLLIPRRRIIFSWRFYF